MSLIVAAFQGFANGVNSNISAMTSDAPFLRDVGVDDITTLYMSSGNGSTRGISAYWDLGSALGVARIRCTARNDSDAGGSIILASSPDGTTWTIRKTLSNVTNAALTSFNQTFATVTARYWRLCAQATASDIFTANTIQMSDFRVYDGSDNEYIIPGLLLLRRLREAA